MATTLTLPPAISAAKLIDHASLIKKGLAVVKKHVKSNKASIFAEDGDRQTLLHVAATQGDVETLTWLLKHYKPLDLKKRDKTGWTPLHAAGYAGKLDNYEALLRKGASPNAQNAHLTSPFVYLCRHAPQGFEPISVQFLSLLDLNVERGLDINSQNTNGDTPLHESASRGMVELTRYLIAKGADLNVMNTVGETALHKAVQSRNPSTSLALVQMLVSNGADAFICGLSGSPLTIALTLNNTEAASYLKERRKKRKRALSSNQSPQDSSVASSTSAPTSTSAGSPSEYRVISTSRHFGPSYDNLDLDTLLGIRPSSESSFVIGTTQKPGPDDIVIQNEGFTFELGSTIEIVADDLADLKLEDDMSSFDYKGCETEDLVNIIGVYKTNRNSSSNPGTPVSPGRGDGKYSTDDRNSLRRYFIITVLKWAENGKLSGVIRTQTGDHRFYIPTSAMKDKTGKNLQAKEVLKELQKEIPELDMKGTSKCVVVDNPELQAELFQFEQSKSLQSSRMKIGVLYAKKDQTTEEQIFGNEHGSPEFEAFLGLLGEKIRLKGWEGFKGDLDVKHDRTGTHSVYTHFRKTDVMFHVATYLPHSTEDKQQIAKKRCIGNDLSTIIYLEEGAVFKPPCVSGDFLHIFAAVQAATTKEGKPGFKVAFSSREGVPNFGPIIPKPAVFASEGGYFRDFILTKLFNGERAALHSEFLVSKMIKTRQMFLESIVQKFIPNLED